MKLLSPILAAAGAVLLAGACKKEAPPPLYEPVQVARRDIVVSAEAAGAVEPVLVVDVKSRASGTILALRAETGDQVRRGDTLVLVDRRDPTNTYNQALADLEVANAQLQNATAQKRRADQMFAAQVLSEQEHEAANLSFANAQAQKVRAEVNLQNARDQLADCNVLAPISGTIIAKNVEAGNVIASATRDISGGTVLLKMADLSVVQVRTLVDETDIGKVQPGMRTTIIVDAFPNRPFEGSVLKIEPQSVVQQNVTMFPVLIRIPNPDGLLKPGMNSEVQIHIGEKRGGRAIPNAALRTSRDVGSAAQVLGLDPQAVQRTLAVQDSMARANPQLAAAGRADAQADGPTAGPNSQGHQPGGRGARGGSGSFGGSTPEAPQGATRGDSGPRGQGAQPGRFGRQGGQQGGFGGGQGGGGGGFTLPPGVTQEQARAVFEKRRNGEPLTAQDSELLAKIRAARGPQGGGGAAGGGGGGGGQFARGGGPGSGMMGPRRSGATSFMFGGNYIVFVLRNGKPAPVRVRTGLTDMDYSEVVSGVSESDTVLLLPSASLVQSQQDMRDRFQRMAGGGVPGMQQQQPSAPSTTVRTGPTRPAR